MTGRILYKLFFFLPLLFSGLSVAAQKPEDLLNSWSEKSPIEKVYLHFDRENYIAGETVWFKAYLYSDFYPDTISTTLYVELLNASSEMVSAKTLPVIYGNTNGQFNLPDTLTTGNYYVRAYSSTLLNHSQDFLFQRSFYINGKKNSITTNAEKKQQGLSFFRKVEIL